MVLLLPPPPPPWAFATEPQNLAIWIQSLCFTCYRCCCLNVFLSLFANLVIVSHWVSYEHIQWNSHRYTGETFFLGTRAQQTLTLTTTTTKITTMMKPRYTTKFNGQQPTIGRSQCSWAQLLCYYYSIFCVNLITCFSEVAFQMSCNSKQDALRSPTEFLSV